MKSFAVIDLETDPFKRGEMPAAFAGGIYDGKSMMIYWDDKIPVEGENWYGRKVCHQIVKEALKRGGTYYLHNGGKFDMFHLLDFLPLDDTKCVVIGSRIVKLTVKCGKNSTEFLDSYAIIPKALKSWGKKDISYVLLDRNNRKKHKLEIIDYLKHHARSIIFSASMPPSAAAAAMAALEIMQAEPERLDKLWANTAYITKAVKDMGFDMGHSESPIIPIYIRDNTLTFQFTQMLFEEGVFVNPVVSPAVSSDSSLIRMSIMATHTQEQLDFAIDKLEKVAAKLHVLEEVKR